MIVLGIETSCDETSIAVLSDNKILANIVSSQWIHTKYGGVVPEIASRAHMRLFLPILQQALEISDISLKDIDLIGVTVGPGLIGAILTGVGFAKSLSLFLDKPFVGVHHIEGHIFSLFLSYPSLSPPLLVLVVSGGHTELIYVEDFLCYKEIGTTVDDACGEAFDKVARILGLGYPGGPYIEKLAREVEEGIKFPRVKVSGYNFSYSGLKTAVKYFYEKNKNEDIRKIAKGFQEVAFDLLIEKTEKAADDLGIKKIGVVGGVSVNKRLRERFKEKEIQKGWDVYFPLPELCTDNAAMIAYAAQKRFEKKGPSRLDMKVFDRLSLERFT